MVRKVEDLRPEFETCSLAGLNDLENGQVPLLKARAADDIASSTAETEKVRCRGVGRRILKRAGIEKCSGNTRTPIRILPWNQISALTPVRIGKVAIAVGDRVPVPSGQSGDTGNLPATNNLVSHASQTAAETLAVSKWQLIKV